MPSTEATAVLNRVLVILQRSFPQYLRYARPYIPAGREEVMGTIEEIVAGQNTLAERVSEMIFDAGDTPDDGKFPIEFADTHDLGIDFLTQQAIQYQKQDIAGLQQCVEGLRGSPSAQMLAEEGLGQAKAHLESLQDLVQRPPGASTTISDAPAYAHDVPVERERAGQPHRQEERKMLAGDPEATG